LAFVDEDGKPMWTIQKERPDSPAKIDAAMAAVLAWEARNDAVAKGIGSGKSVYEDRGLLVV
jgi:phage terminase large subunit-like protein